jgi:hypothetical protein
MEQFRKFLRDKGFVLALLACSTVWLLNGSFQSFVYFQF